MTTDPFCLSNHDIWVFGGAGYLGREVVKLLVAQEARVLCVDQAQVDLGKAVTTVTLDVNDTAAVEAFAADQIKLRGVPHGLVVMTYASTAKRFDDLSVEDFDLVNHGNLTATFALTRAIGQHMAAQAAGSIVLFSSMYGSVSPDPSMYASPMNPNPIEYGVGKAGIQQMARYLAVHWGPQNVRCNSVSPGPFPNPLIQKDQPEFVARLAQKVPLRRVGQSGEIAGSVAFLLSNASTFITGQNLAVDGGWTSW